MQLLIIRSITPKKRQLPAFKLTVYQPTRLTQIAQKTTRMSIVRGRVGIPNYLM